MTSLGKACKTGLLLCNEIKCTGQIQGGNKLIGPEYNQSHLDHNGSVFYIKWSAVHQCDTLTTTDTSTDVTWTTTANHGLEVGDTIHIGRLQGPILAVNNIPATELTGTQLITAVPSATSFTYAVTTAANATSTTAAGTPHVRCDRYKSIDMATNATTWTHGTTQPAPTHTNIENFFF